MRRNRIKSSAADGANLAMPQAVCVCSRHGHDGQKRSARHPVAAPHKGLLMDDLLADYPAVIGLMPTDRDFTSHEFILALAQRRQGAYITALSGYAAGDAPFRTLHGQLSQALYDYPALVRHTGEVASEDIFRSPGRCASWRRV
ncbi:hypothetical protein [Tuwongella immobilis]|uniref:Marine sediment metagenome DNA, contig: S12H4_S11028 n=1 Tax=Tuwongella immobilis TaxID=692036 RepID=A0A6C2YSP5_9BACT|nr:hypothetical protein [Tuwongella immobilis]VIP04730.1 Marine sediment metagenome DNA, contig: S12H4_S11028 OS=marine sediment metagenome GN=S12H4_41670 PE=4 SV=1 [Tuwongella immobilis]VTS06819.1 Marine sediment metagenome DNA, contig: S12H4_S11028 OS=marine sediment metagenome GN=S12H4_41670 PE=4 SV=1 [Tuwongella immobilis]